MEFYRSYKWLLPSLLFTCALIATRIIFTGEITFSFLVWNLFLAMLPLFLAYKARRSAKNLGFLSWSVLWLLFFPNSIYLVTDILHLGKYPDVPRWFDLILLTSAALNGLMLGLLSLYQIEQRMQKLIARPYSNTLLFFLLLLCGYGIYLGRYLRWNSWDIVTAPFSLADDISQHLIHPYRNFNVWAISLLFATWIYLVYKIAKRWKKEVVLS